MVPRNLRQLTNVGCLLACWMFLIAGVDAKVQGLEWTSPNGIITVTAPEDARFVQVENPPEPFLALWISTDESLRLGVTQTPLPSEQRLIRSSVDEGFAEELGGSVTSATSTVNNGHEIWVTSVSGAHSDTKMVATQAIVRVDDFVYKIMAMTVGNVPEDEATIQSFLQSIQVSGSPHSGGIAGNRDSAVPMTSDEAIQKVSYLLGRVVGMVLMILLVVWALGLFNRKPRQPTPSNPPGPPT